MKKIFAVGVTVLSLSLSALADGGIVTLDGGIVTFDGGIVTLLLTFLSGGIVT